jgi:hypothetical protein
MFDLWCEGEGLPLRLVTKEGLIELLLRFEALLYWGCNGVPLTSEEEREVKVALSNIRKELSNRGVRLGPVIAGGLRV